MDILQPPPPPGRLCHSNLVQLRCRVPGQIVRSCCNVFSISEGDLFFGKKPLVAGGIRLEYLTAPAGVVLLGKFVWGRRCQIFRAFRAGVVGGCPMNEVCMRQALSDM